MHPSIRHVQLGLTSLGFDPGAADGWWGPATAAAANALHAEGPRQSTDWAIQQLQTGLAELGHHTGRPSGDYDPATRSALGALIDAGGLPKAAVAVSSELLMPAKPKLRRVSDGGVMRQGKAGYVITSFMLHCGAFAGSWHRGKSNREMFDAVRDMHTLPVSQGGNGWIAPGYHGIVFPDGEIMDARPRDVIGAGARGYNRGVYHLLMIETRTITTTLRPESYFTPETLASVKDHIEWVAQRTPLERLLGHREVAAKLCPGFEVVDHEWTDRAVA